MAFLFRLMYAYFENKAILKVASGVRDKKERKCDCHSEKRLYLCTRVGNIVRPGRIHLSAKRYIFLTL